MAICRENIDSLSTLSTRITEWMKIVQYENVYDENVMNMLDGWMEEDTAVYRKCAFIYFWSLKFRNLSNLSNLMNLLQLIGIAVFLWNTMISYDYQ